MSTTAFEAASFGGTAAARAKTGFRLVQPDGAHNEFEGIIGSSSSLKQVLTQVKTVAPTDSTVLIRGETGTGKEVIARAIHNSSSRRHRPFVKLNCAAIPLGLLESELFGHERGAFTGAISQKIGRFEAANGGTLFLDEIGDIPLELQAKLLRVLQEREFERLGSTRTQHVDVRIVAATHRDLLRMVDDREFRLDLYYRLYVFPVELPPLRERRKDIAMLVRHFIELFAERMNKHIDVIPQVAMEAMESYDWPGNIRELQNFIERSVILSAGAALRAPIEQLDQSARRAQTLRGNLADLEREQIVQTLRDTRWIVGGRDGAAARLGVPRTTLISKMQKLGIQKSSNREASVELPSVPEEESPREFSAASAGVA